MFILTVFLSEKQEREQSNVLSDIGEERTEKYAHMNDLKTVVLIYLTYFRRLKCCLIRLFPVRLIVREIFN
jgi:hypothetical protein